MRRIWRRTVMKPSKKFRMIWFVRLRLMANKRATLKILRSLPLLTVNKNQKGAKTCHPMHLLKLKTSWDIKLLTNIWNFRWPSLILPLGGGDVWDYFHVRRWIAVHWMFEQLVIYFDDLCLYISMQDVSLWNSLTDNIVPKMAYLEVNNGNMHMDSNGYNCSCKRCIHKK